MSDYDPGSQGMVGALKKPRLSRDGLCENCVKEYEGLGFVQAQNLTPEQRDNLPSKPTR